MNCDQLRVLLIAAVSLMPLVACRVVRTEAAIQPVSAEVEASANPVQATTFASLIRAPGERVSLNQPTVSVTPRPEPELPLPHWPTEPIRPAGNDPFTALTSSALPAPPAGLPPLMIPEPVASGLPPDPPLLAAIRAYIEGKPDQAIPHLKSLDKPNQELMLQLIPAVVRASQIDLEHASPTELGVMAEQLRGPAEQLAARGPLVLDRVCFCRWVKNFGRYEPLPDGVAFKPSSLAELYVEVRNVPSLPVQTPTEGVGFVTKLSCTLQLSDASGAGVPLVDRNRRSVPALTETKRDFTRSPIRDYFLLFRFPVPDRPGNYDVTIKVHDPAGGREVSRTVTKVRVE